MIMQRLSGFQIASCVYWLLFDPWKYLRNSSNVKEKNVCIWVDCFSGLGLVEVSAWTLGCKSFHYLGSFYRGGGGSATGDASGFSPWSHFVRGLHLLSSGRNGSSQSSALTAASDFFCPLLF